MTTLLQDAPKLSVALDSKAFIHDPTPYYIWMNKEAPICQAKLKVLSVCLVSGYELCKEMLNHPDLIRDRTAAKGKSAFSFLMPHSLEMMLHTIITSDDPDHRRQRQLVAKAFTPKAIARIEARIERLSHKLLDAMETQAQPVDLISAYSKPIPVTVIQEILGVPQAQMDMLQDVVDMLISSGSSTLKLPKAMLIDIPKVVKFMEKLIAHKRQRPGDDILTHLIHAEEQGDRLSPDELTSLSMILIIAGYETTVHLITNATLTLINHPDQCAMLREDESLWDGAIEELLRFSGPIHSTKPTYAARDVELGGVLIPKGTMLMPMLGAANIDPTVFERPEVFDITRQGPRHLGFGHGPHVCLGAALARMEARVGLKNLFARFPELTLAIDEKDLVKAQLPAWHRFLSFPVLLRP